MKKRLFAALLALTLPLTACTAEEGSAFSSEAASSSASSVSSASSSASSSSSETSSSAETDEYYLGDFTAETVTGETVDQTIFADAKLTVINVWATYCGPCKMEMPILGNIAREREGEVQILGVVTDVIDQYGNPVTDQVDFALEIMEDSNVEYTNLILNESLAMIGFASFTAVPATLFVDSDGNLVGQGFYGSLDEDSWNIVINERLGMIEE